MAETAQVAAGLVESEIAAMKEVTYEFTDAGLTMEDNVDIVSGWDCTSQDTVIKALAGEIYFSEPKIKNGGKLCSYFSAPLWKDGVANSEIIGSVIFMSNDYFLQDIMWHMHLLKELTDGVLQLR